MILFINDGIDFAHTFHELQQIIWHMKSFSDKILKHTHVLAACRCSMCSIYIGIGNGVAVLVAVIDSNSSDGDDGVSFLLLLLLPFHIRVKLIEANFCHLLPSAQADSVSFRDVYRYIHVLLCFIIVVVVIAVGFLSI